MANTDPFWCPAHRSFYLACAMEHGEPLRADPLDVTPRSDAPLTRHRDVEVSPPLLGILLITVIASAFWFAVGLVIGANWP